MKKSLSKMSICVERITLVVLISSLTVVCLAQFGGGQGTEEDPWQVGRAEHLNEVRNYLGTNHRDKHWIQTGDIDLDVAPWNQGAGWVPIGNSTTNAFMGVYDGNGHIVSGVFIDLPGREYVGLFGHTAQGGIIKNLGVVDVDITGGNYVGAVLGRNLSASKVINCFCTGVVSGNGSRIGGLLGYNQNGGSNVIDCYSRVNVNGGNEIGGLVGHNRNGAAVTGSYSTGRVSGPGTVGGLVGFTQTWGEDPPDNNYWDIETSGQEGSEVGIGKLSRQMVYPYDGDTYVGWDFEETWDHDQTRAVNGGYPILYYQENIPPLDAPEITVDLIEVEGFQNIRIRWEPVEDALSYRIYSASTPNVANWGLPVAVVGRDAVEYKEPVDEANIRFYRVTASYESDRGERATKSHTRRRNELRKTIAPQNNDNFFPGDEIIDENENIVVIGE